MMDGMTHAFERYVAWFACFERSGELVTVLLRMAPHLNEDYGVQIEQCRFLVGDCVTNCLLATLMEVLLVGCASHRLNRAMQYDMVQHEDDLAAVGIIDTLQI
ncbi:hypothetical protein L916_18729 [Phytophthora nicotianae]|uniref:Uncharacterized protein n=1 Tax=Phytophthora nicotianae TaxID=4792 RepID=W2I338_PHYNI|nr:hypothetical protein L916_18729 [Phytophthora nicotianae]